MIMQIQPWKLASLLLLSTSAWAQMPQSEANSDPTQWVGIQEEGEEGDQPLPDKRDEVKELIATLKDHAGARGKEDTEAVATIELLMNEFPKSGPKDRAALAKAVADVFNQARKQNEDQTYNNDMYIAASVALSYMGPESANELVKWVDNKKHNANLVLRASLIQSLGKTKAEVGIKPILKLLGHKDIPVEAAAAQALGNYSELELKKRKEIFEEVLKALMSAKNNKDADINNQDPTKAKRYDSVSASMLTTLEALSKHKEGTPEEWQRWWNKNKKDDWDEPKEG